MSGRPRILVAEAEDFSPRAAELLRELGELRLEDLDRDGLLGAVADAGVLWVRLRNRVDAEVLAAAPRLRVVVTPTTGLNHVDLDECERRGVRVLSLRGETEFLKDIRATAEHTIALMLALLRNVPAAAAHVEAGGFDRDGFKGGELYEKTVGLVGYGRLGRIVGRYLVAFGARVLADDGKPDLPDPEPGVEHAPLERLLAESDIVSLHVNLVPETRDMFGPAQFAAMRPGALFVNTARGELVDEQALLDALRSGRLAGAALDVLRDERQSGMEGHPLVAHAREHRNVLITPHVGGATRESMERTEVFMAQRLAEALAEDAAAPAGAGSER